MSPVASHPFPASGGVTAPAASFARRIGAVLRTFSVHPGAAYVAIVLLQLKVVWGMWRVRDLTSGDTSSYFVSAHTWHAAGLYNVLWSPLYLVYYGSFLGWTADAHRVTIAHRLVLILLLAVLVLGLMRRMLEPRIAWLTAAWWVVLPVNHDVLYEVHLFGVIPVILASVVLLGPATAWRRGIGLGLLLAGWLFVRNELLVPTLLLGAACAWQEARGRSLDESARRGGRLLAYGGPVAVCLVVLTVFCANSSIESHALRASLRAKHTVNVCQIYAFGYQQRYTDWDKSPWVECQELMMRTFAQPLPTMGEALLANPRAMLEHFRWNVALIPSGLQVLLFNETFGAIRPGYEPVTAKSSVALVLSALLGLIYLGGTVAMARDWNYWWSTWLRPRVWSWLALACVAIGCLVVMVTQRPRPAYLFALELGLQAGAGLCVQALLRHWGLGRWLDAAFPILIAVLLIAVPSYYRDAPDPPRRPLRAMYRALVPFQSVIQAPGTVIVTPGYGFEVCAYVRDRPGRMCRSLDYYRLRSDPRAAEDWWSLLAARGATMFYANEAVTGDRVMRASLAGAEAAGWEILMRRPTERGEQWLLRRKVLGTELATGERMPA